MYKLIESKLSLAQPEYYPKFIVLHCGTNDLDRPVIPSDIADQILDDICKMRMLIGSYTGNCRLIWSDVLYRLKYRGKSLQRGMAQTDFLNAVCHLNFATEGDFVLRHYGIEP